MPQTVKHNAGELRVLVLPLDELLADEDRLHRQTVGQTQEHRQHFTAGERAGTGQGTRAWIAFYGGFIHNFIV